MPEIPAHARFKAQRKFGSLDGLRALSVVAVIWHHTAAHSVPGSAWSAAGAHGVTLFFAISGFLITTLLLRERERHGQVDLKAFYIRRSLRIFPLYYAVLLAYVVLVWVLERHAVAGQQFFANLPYFATYTSNIFVERTERTIFYFAWSLATEEQFYLVWPPILYCLASTRREVLLLTVILMLLVANQAFFHIALAGIVPIALVGGAFAAVSVHTARGFGVWYPLVGNRYAFPLATLALIVALSVQGTPEALIHVFSVLVVVAAVIRDDHALAGWMRWRVLAYVGTISYGIYLLHMLCKNAVQLAWGSVISATPSPWVLFPLTTVASIVVAGVSFKYFESFFLRLKLRHQR